MLLSDLARVIDDDPTPRILVDAVRRLQRQFEALIDEISGDWFTDIEAFAYRASSG